MGEGGYADTMTVDSLADFNGNVRSPIMHLKRGTTFIALLLDRFCTTDWSLRAAAKDAYVDTLGTYHGWTTRQGVKVALYALPSRDTFLETLAQSSTRSSASSGRAQTRSTGFSQPASGTNSSSSKHPLPPTTTQPSFHPRHNNTL